MSRDASALYVNDETYLAALCRAVPYHIVERVLLSPTEAALEPFSADASVLSADLVGFTTLSHRLVDAGSAALSAISELLDRLFTEMQLAAFFPLGGRITEFGGDAVTVVFLGEGHARRAVDAGLRVLEVVEREAKASTQDDLRGLRMRVGVSAGRIRLSVLGDLSRRVTFCGGEATHRALVLQGAAMAGTCVADEHVVALAGPGLRCTPGEAGRFVVSELSPPEPDSPFEYLGDRIKGQTREKIQLLEPFVPAPLARRLRTTPNGWRLEPEIRRDVVVAFADVTGFHTQSPELFLAGQDLARSLMRAFQKYDGMVLKCTAIETGHRVMILFGAHHLAGNESEKAVLASVEAITRLRGFQPTLPGELTIRIGLHRGPVFFGGVGGRSKHDLTALGDTVNVAARAAAAAPPFSVVATSAVADEVSQIFSMTPMGEVGLKGIPGPVHLHEIHGIKGGRAHYARRRANRRFSAGRFEQEAELERTVTASIGRRGSMIGICGDAGTGKSHILSNVVDRWIELGGIALVSRCLYAHRTIPLAPVRDLFDAFLGVTDGDSDADRTMRIRTRLGELGLGNDAALLAFLQPVRRPDGFNESLLDLSDPDAADRLVTSIIRVVEKRVESQQLMYVLEDIHLADSLTLRVIQSLATLRRDRPYMFLATYRPEPRVSAVRRSVDQEHSLPHLELPDAVELVRHETRARTVDPEILQFLWQRAQGNPQHLIETLRFLSERWLIRVDDTGKMVPAAALQSLEEIVPPTWAQVAVARLDGTTELERRVLRTASAIGFSFNAEVLAQVETELPDDIVEASLRGLEDQLWVSPEVRTRQLYRFRDEVTRSVVYSIIPERERQLLHRRIAGAIERVAAGASTLLPALAHHWERAGELDLAARLWTRVIEQTRSHGLSIDVDRFVNRIKALRDRLRG